MSVPLTGRVTPRGDSAPRAGTPSDYRVTVEIPEGAQTTLSAGQTAAVTLPIIHHQEARGTVESTAGALHLVLSNQVQELNGQQVQVLVPLRAQGLFRLPFQSVYSPRGVTKRVMVVRGKSVEAVEVKVIALAGESDVIVAGSLSNGESVVVDGLDNLLPADPVEPVVEVSK